MKDVSTLSLGFLEQHLKRMAALCGCCLRLSVGIQYSGSGVPEPCRAAGQQTVHFKKGPSFRTAILHLFRCGSTLFLIGG